jgi:hypothetical protein
VANSLLLISKVKEDLEFATEVARSSDLTLVHAKDMLDGVNIMAEQDPMAIFIDASTDAAYQPFEQGVQEKLGLYSEKTNANHIHFISSESIDALPQLTKSPLFGHIIMRKFQNPKEAGHHYARIVRATLKDKSFGLANLMKPGVKVQSVKLVNSLQKQGVVEALKNFILAAKFQPRIAVVIANAIDEVLMNAIFDAPADEIGNPKYSKTSRNSEIKLEGKAEVEVQVAFDGLYVGITAIDRYGSLDKAKLLAHVTKAYSEEDYKLKSSQAGAGLGLGTVYRTGGSFLFSSEARERTEVTIFFKRTTSFRDFREQFRFISTQFYL